MSCEAPTPHKPADGPAAAKALLSGSFMSAARLGHLAKFLFEALVVKSPGKKLGIDVQPVCVLGREGLGVKGVSPGGAVDEYNHRCNEGSQIKKGDTILGVSGLTGVTASRMMQELLTQTELQLLVLSAQARGEGSEAAARRGKKQAGTAMTGLVSEAHGFSSGSTCASSYASADASIGAFSAYGSSMVSSSKRSGSSALEPQGFACAAAFGSDLAASAASYSTGGASDLIEPVRRSWVAATRRSASFFGSDDSRSASSAEDLNPAVFMSMESMPSLTVEDFLADMDAAPRILDIIRARNSVKKSKRRQAPLAEVKAGS